MMTVYISLLRGVNVGGLKIPMAELRKLYESLNFNKVKSYIQSGNLIFESPNPEIKKLEEEIEEKLENIYHFHIPILIRTADELGEIIKNNPFAMEDLKNVYVTFLKENYEEVPINQIDERKESSEKFLINQREIYLFLPNGYGRTKISNNYFESKLKITATTRNWRTVTRLYKLANNL